MDKRESERVQFFTARDEHGLHPVWVFRYTTRDDSHLGLLLDISDFGVQVLTRREALLDGDLFQLLILNRHADPAPLMTAIVERKWSIEDGTLYLRHSFAFDEAADVSMDAIDSIISERNAGEQWLRCELIDLRAPNS